MAQKEKKYLLVWSESDDEVRSFSSDSFDEIEKKVSKILFEDFDLSQIDEDFEPMFKVFDLDTREQIPFSFETKVIMVPVSQVKLNR